LQPLVYGWNSATVLDCLYLTRHSRSLFLQSWKSFVTSSMLQSCKQYSDQI